MPDRMFDYHSHTKPVSDILSRGEPQKSSFQNAFSNKYEFKAKREKGPHRFLDPDILTCEEVVNLLTLNEKESSNVLSSIAQERAIDIISKRLPTQKEKQEIQEQVYDWLEKVEADPQLTRQAIHEEVEKTDREVEEFMKANSELIAKANSTIMEIVKKI